ncbi:zinc ribbon domain-containing protein [Saccharothrix variisporea]|uniref:zinc ribbon domain-containing protein n=1 Tax=Saccharothrix variisporea TaxID=543527 RepID=UPI00319DA724
MVSEHAFVAVQRLRTARPTRDGIARVYRLAGYVHCQPCGRRMDSHWAHGRPGYRCRHRGSGTEQGGTANTRTLYMREDELLTKILVVGRDFSNTGSKGSGWIVIQFGIWLPHLPTPPRPRPLPRIARHHVARSQGSHRPGAGRPRAGHRPAAAQRHSAQHFDRCPNNGDYPGAVGA